jgi:hypothetical protein
LVDCPESLRQRGDELRPAEDLHPRAHLHRACGEHERQADGAAEAAASRKSARGRPGGTGDRRHHQLAGTEQVVASSRAEVGGVLDQVGLNLRQVVGGEALLDQRRRTRDVRRGSRGPREAARAAA